MMNITEQSLLVTAQPEFSSAALAELRQLDPSLHMQEELTPGIMLCQVADSQVCMRRAVRTRPTFARHLAPVQQQLALSNTEQDIGKIALAFAALPTFALIDRGIHFAVQTRIVQTDLLKAERAYSGGHLNQALAEAFIEETGAIESIKKPQVVLSLLCTADTAYLGISSAEDNLSSWPGGARHFAQTDEQISRAEFKLLEALEEFEVALPEGGRALDLGAAPGGWARILLEAGMDVVAVDPARLDPRLVGQKHLEHYRGYAERYLATTDKRATRFDVIVNDMRMDARDAARLLVTAAPRLKTQGFLITTFKLPHATSEIDPLATLKEALRILQRGYAYSRARQLFHNRQEVTVVAAQPRPVRA